MNGVCDRYCKGCVYNAEINGIPRGYCNYIFVERKRRPCPAGRGCVVKVKGKTKVAKED